MKPLLRLMLGFVLVASAAAQNIILKDGKVIATKGVRRTGDIIMATIELSGTTAAQPSPAGQVQAIRTGEFGYPIAQIYKIDFPEPAQLNAAAALVNSGKAIDAIKQIEPVLAYYDAVRDAPGSWWSDALILKIQALLSLGNYDAADRLASQMERIATDPEAIDAARVYVAAGLARKGDHAKALQVYDAVLNEATRPQTLAVSAANKGVSHLARREWEAALLSVLEVPVFYPRQEALMPSVLLSSARAYIGLEDYNRAKSALGELGSKFPSTPEGAQAKSELDRIAKLEKTPQSAK